MRDVTGSVSERKPRKAVAAKPVQRSGIPRSVPCGWTALGARLGREDFRLEVTWLGSGRTWTGIHIFS